jgi:hypothetical protein
MSVIVKAPCLICGEFVELVLPIALRTIEPGDYSRRPKILLDKSALYEHVLQRHGVDLASSPAQEDAYWRLLTSTPTVR